MNLVQEYDGWDIKAIVTAKATQPIYCHQLKVTTASQNKFEQIWISIKICFKNFPTEFIKSDPRCNWAQFLIVASQVSLTAKNKNKTVYKLRHLYPLSKISLIFRRYLPKLTQAVAERSFWSSQVKSVRLKASVARFLSWSWTLVMVTSASI